VSVRSPDEEITMTEGAAAQETHDETCDECGSAIPATTASLINTHHADSCSLWGEDQTCCVPLSDSGNRQNTESDVKVGATPIRYADVTYDPDYDDERPWLIHCYEGSLREWGDDFCWSFGAANHAEAMEIADEWVNRKGLHGGPLVVVRAASMTDVAAPQLERKT